MTLWCSQGAFALTYMVKILKPKVLGIQTSPSYKLADNTLLNYFCFIKTGRVSMHCHSGGQHVVRSLQMTRLALYVQKIDYFEIHLFKARWMSIHSYLLNVPIYNPQHLLSHIEVSQKAKLRIRRCLKIKDLSKESEVILQTISYSPQY